MLFLEGKQVNRSMDLWFVSFLQISSSLTAKHWAYLQRTNLLALLVLYCPGGNFSLGLMIHVVALKDWEEVQNRIC